MRHGGFAQAGRAGEQHVVDGLIALLGGLDADAQRLLDLLLPHEIIEGAGAQLTVVVFIALGGIDDAVGRHGGLLCKDAG